jgi:hypothetical protein
MMRLLTLVSRSPWRIALVVAAVPVVAYAVLLVTVLSSDRVLRHQSAALIAQSALRVTDAVGVRGRHADSIQQAMIAAANAQGAAHPRPRGPVAKAYGYDLELPGSTADRRCVSVDNITAGRSGEIVSGAWAGTRLSYTQRWTRGIGKLWWKALYDLYPSAEPHRPASSPILVRALRLDRQLAPGVESRSGEQSFVERRGDTLVFMASPAGTSGIRVPTPGRWMFIATSGPNWGCFLYRV